MVFGSLYGLLLFIGLFCGTLLHFIITRLYFVLLQYPMALDLYCTDHYFCYNTTYLYAETDIQIISDALLF